MEETSKFERNLLHMRKHSLWAGEVAPSERWLLHKCEHLNLMPSTHIMTCTLIPALGVGGDRRSLGLTSQQAQYDWWAPGQWKMLFVRQSGRCLKKWHLRVSSVSHRHRHTHACWFTHGCSCEVMGWQHGLPESRTLWILQGRRANSCGCLALLSIKCWGLGTVHCVPFSALSVIGETVHRQSCTGLLSALVKPQHLGPKNHGDEDSYLRL